MSLHVDSVCVCVCVCVCVLVRVTKELYPGIFQGETFLFVWGLGWAEKYQLLRDLSVCSILKGKEKERQKPRKRDEVTNLPSLGVVSVLPWLQEQDSCREGMQKGSLQRMS